MIKLKRIRDFIHEASTRHHKIFSDIRADLGGEDYGMNPHEILETSLGACTAITIQMYANRKNIPLVDVRVEVQILSEGAISVINQKIILIGELTKDQRYRLMEIANKCPIHRLLESTITIQNLEYPHK